MTYVFVALILAVVAVLAWTWWSARAERDPASSVDTFTRALHAMQPSTVGDGPRDTDSDDVDTERDTSHDPNA